MEQKEEQIPMLKFTDNNGISITFTDNSTYLFNGRINVPYNGLYIVKTESGYTFNKISDGDVLFTCKEFYIDDNIGTIESYASTFYKADSDSETIKQLEGIISDFVTAYDENFGDTIYPSDNLPENAVAGTYYNNTALYNAIVAKGVTPATKHIEDYATAISNISSGGLDAYSAFVNKVQDASKWNVVDNGFWQKPIFIQVSSWNGVYDVVPSSNISLMYTFQSCFSYNSEQPLFGDNFLSKVTLLETPLKKSSVAVWKCFGKFTNLKTLQYKMVEGYYEFAEQELVFDSQKTVTSCPQFFELYMTDAYSAATNLKFPQEFIVDSPTNNTIQFGNAIKYITGSAGFKGMSYLYLGCSINYPYDSTETKTMGKFIGYKNLDGTWYDFSDAPKIKSMDIGGPNVSQEWLEALSNGICSYKGNIKMDSTVLAAMSDTVKANFTNKGWTLIGG